jgi:hypothetical protein
VRYFFSRRIPDCSSILLVESGSRSISEKLLPILRTAWKPDTPIDLITCYSKLPEGFGPETRVWRVTDYRGREARGRLYQELREKQHAVIGIICSGEPLMTKWKWALAWQLPGKVFLINENADFFWLDRGHIPILRELMMTRAGLAGAGAVRTLARVFSFPFTLTYLLLYATTVHARRALRSSRG